MQNQQTATAPEARKGAGASTLKGADLVPNIDPKSIVTDASKLFWVGLLKEAPVEDLSLCGISFPKMNEDLVQDPRDPIGKTRVPRFGAQTRLTKAHVTAIKERLRRTVIRFYTGPSLDHEPGTGVVTTEQPVRRRGQVITIPTEAEVRAREEQGLPTNRYQPDPRDEPAARYVFAIPGKRGDYVPQPLEQTGLEWPSD